MVKRNTDWDSLTRLFRSSREEIEEICFRHRIGPDQIERVMVDVFAYLAGHRGGSLFAFERTDILPDVQDWLLRVVERSCRRVIREISSSSRQASQEEVQLIQRVEPSDVILEITDKVTARLLEQLRTHPESLRSLRPRQFEEVVAELLANHGWQVTLTPESKDGGYDIFGICKDISGVSNAWIIECKRYRQDRKVGVEIVRSLWGVSTHMQGVNPMVATTSDFTRGAKEFKASVYNMDLRNYSSILDWINEYKPHPEGKLYIKENRLVVPGEG